jgi:hypothetical protein
MAASAYCNGTGYLALGFTPNGMYVIAAHGQPTRR